MNIKKLIAREGLILIGTITAIVISILVSAHLRTKISEYKQNAVIYEIFDGFQDPSLSEYNTTHKGRWIAVRNIYVMAHPSTPARIMREALKRDFPDIKEPEFEKRDNNHRICISKYYDNYGKAKSVDDLRILIYISLALYPAYLLLRFIWWAIRTLRT